MQLKDRIIVITGAASGIGKALAERCKSEGAKAIVCADYNGDGVRAVAADVGGTAFEVDVSKEADIKNMIDRVEQDIGPIDLFCSNAGILMGGGAEVADAEWQRIWEINVMAHIWAARHMVPIMLARGGGYLLNTASAAGLLSQVGSAPYAVTKHAAVAFAEWLALTHGADGLKVSVLCPQAVRTEMTKGHEDGVASINGMMAAEDVADACVKTINEEKFLVLPHPEVEKYMRNKTADYDRWIAGMQKLNAQFNTLR